MLLPPVTLSLSESGIRIHLHGGSAKDKDALYNFIARWPGWMRHPSNGMDGAYSGPMSPYTCLLLTKLIGQTQVHYQNEETKNAIHQSVERLHQAEAALKCTKVASPDRVLGRVPMLHQLQAIRAIEQMGGKTLLADDMGLGKTTTAIASVSCAMVVQTVVLCPASVVWNWEREILACLPKATVVLIQGTPQQRATQFSELRYLEGGPIFLVMNYDKLNVCADDQLAQIARFASGQALICDECLDGDTMVMTDVGRATIRDMVELGVGNNALSLSENGELEWKRITRRIKHYGIKANRTIRHERGSLSCTDGHEIKTRNKGPCAVELLEPGDMLNLLETDHGSPIQQRVLPSRVFSNLQEGSVSNLEKPEQGSKIQGQGQEGDDEEAWEAISGEEGRPWSEGPDSAIEVVQCYTEEGRLYGAFRKHQRRKDGSIAASVTLLSGYRNPGVHVGYRGGRIQPQGQGGQGTRQEEGQVPEKGGMDRATLFQRASSGILASVHQGDSVYDIEVEENHNYFANGILVGNSHYLKNRKATRSQLVHSLFVDSVRNFGTQPPEVRLLLSGTPVQNTVDDLYSQIQLIRPGTWTSYTDFQRRYLTMVPIRAGNKVRFECRGTKNLEELNAIVSTIQIRRVKEDVLDLPPKMRTFPSLEMDNVTTRIYKAMKEFALLQLTDIEDDTSCLKPVIQNALTAAIRCEQIAQGFCGGIPDHMMETFSGDLIKHAEKIPGRPNELVFPQSAKMAWILETITALLSTGKVPVVFSRFNAPMFWLAAQFPGSLVLHGGVPMSQRQELITQYDEGKCRVLFCQIRMAQGLNFLRSQDEIFIGRDWAPALNMQAEDRCHRIGQKGTVNVQVPIVLHTIEERLHKRLEAKSKDASAVLVFRTVKDIREAL